MWRSVTLVALLLVAPLAHAQAPREKLNATAAALKATAADEKALREKLEGSKHDIEKLRDDATSLAAELQQSERQVNAEEKRYGTLATTLAKRQADFNARKQEYAHTLASILRMQDVPATALIANPENVHQVLRTTRVMQQVNGALAARAAQLRTEVTRLAKLRDSAAASKKRLGKETATLNEKQKRLNRDLAKRQALQQQLARDHAAAKARVATLSRESASLQELISKLEEDRASVARRGQAPVRTTPTASRGQWKLPVVGSVTHRYGQRKNANETYRGVEIQARAGASVVAPASGEVVFTGPFRDYGRMVLVKHSGGHISLLAGLGTINVTLNQPVKAGEPLGSMGGGRPSLYYELREGSKPIDPADWFANLSTNTARR